MSRASSTSTLMPALARGGGDEAVHARADDDQRRGVMRRVLRGSAQRRQPARRAHDAAAGVRARAALVQPADRRAVLRPARRRPQEEELVQRQLALEDVALGEAGDALDVGRREHLPVQDGRLDVRRVLARACRSPRRRTPRASRRSSRRSGCTARTARRSTSRACPAAPCRGSIIDGMMMSMYGLRENSPYLASS